MKYVDSKFKVERRLRWARENSIGIIETDIIKSRQNISEDTKQRQELQKEIQKMRKEGKTKQEILKKLMFLTAAKGYNPNWIKYYESWIENSIAKGKSAEKDDESER